jgi:hypothetical protein
MNQINWEKIGKGLEKYRCIMALYNDSFDLSKEDLFQKRFKGFYRMGRKPEKYYRDYFRLFEQIRNGKKLTIAEVLYKLFESEKRKELSFASKMLATTDPNLPVWDSKVRDVLNNKYKTNFKDTYKEISECIEAYYSLCNWYKLFLKSPEAKALISEFDICFPKSKISKIKKIDFIFWQTSIK